LYIINHFKIPAENILAVEDSAAGITAALAAGIEVFGYDNGMSQNNTTATFKSNDMTSLLQLV